MYLREFFPVEPIPGYLYARRSSRHFHEYADGVVGRDLERHGLRRRTVGTP
jgi:hypothetical protein